MQEIASELGGEGFEWATTPEERTRLWTARHHAYFAGAADEARAAARVTTDTCVPISRLAECVTTAWPRPTAAGLPHYIVGHVGDGNFHIAYLVDPNDPGGARDWPSGSTSELVQRAIDVQGTCTGEHGIGLHKMGFLVDEAGAGAVDADAQLKRALDPKNIMNPGKIFAL